MRKQHNCESVLPSLLRDLANGRMVRKGVYLTPTLGCYGAMARPPFENFLPPDGQVKNREVMKLGLHALKVSLTLPLDSQR